MKMFLCDGMWDMQPSGQTHKTLSHTIASSHFLQYVVSVLTFTVLPVSLIFSEQ